MYKLLVVEDEIWVRKGLLSKISHKDFEFSCILEASNGVEALEIMEKEHPDIVITDIRMRQMDGIELIQEANKLYPNSKFIIISGYAEFEYAEQAINMGVCGYLLKPIKDKNIEEALQKAINQLDMGRDNNEIKQKKVILERKHDDLVLEQKINSLLHGEKKYDNAEQEISGSTGYELCDNLMLLLVHIDQSSYSNSKFSYYDTDLIKFSIKNIITEICEVMNIKVITINNLMDSNQVLAVVSHNDKSYLSNTCDSLIIEIFSKIKKYLKISIIIATSDIANTLGSGIYKKTKGVFDLRLVYGYDHIYRYNSLRNDKAFAIPEQELRLLEKCIQLYDFKNTLTILKDIFSADKLKEATSGYIRLLYFEIVNILMGVCNKMGIDLSDSFFNEVLTEQVLDSCYSGADIVNYLYTTIIDTLKTGNIAVQDCKSLIGRAREYIEKNYSEAISLKELAMRFAMNSSYFSTVFKQEVGMTITKYLVDLRMQKACNLLSSTELSISDIAKRVGYPESEYFYRVFKKAIGMTPLEYRNNK